MRIADTNTNGVGTYMWVTGGTIISKAAVGVRVGGGVGSIYLDEVDIFDNTTGVYVDTLLSATSTSNGDITFTNCVVDSSQAHGVEIASGGATNLSFNGVFASNSGSIDDGGHPDGCNIRVHAGGIVSSSTSTNMIVKGCKIFNAYGDGLYLESGAWTITGCDISLNGIGTTSSGYGIYLTNSATAQSVIVGNTIRDNGHSASTGVGVFIDTSVSSYILSDNLVIGNGSANITDNGTTPKVVANNLT